MASKCPFRSVATRRTGRPMGRNWPDDAEFSRDSPNVLTKN
ncbi:hypothetical protein EBBID32_41160 [Sphingobium indicum BiD32]|uniref:Uncharacterized protein n=1 Tax=Sphingobium indicum BiD32 TaxID=1301087 RepID=N1MS21_9SPHN|nr:hypothetical protein EBBID32_41160 [Sphingobium indicum BiD32]